MSGFMEEFAGQSEAQNMPLSVEAVHQSILGLQQLVLIDTARTPAPDYLAGGGTPD
jgi:hypothetical protein